MQTNFKLNVNDGSASSKNATKDIEDPLDNVQFSPIDSGDDETSKSNLNDKNESHEVKRMKCHQGPWESGEHFQDSDQSMCKFPDTFANTFDKLHARFISSRGYITSYSFGGDKFFDEGIDRCISRRNQGLAYHKSTKTH